MATITSPSQKDRIRLHLLLGRPLTAVQALREYGCGRLAARINDLRKEGLNIKTVHEKGNGKHWARYSL